MANTINVTVFRPPDNIILKNEPFSAALVGPAGPAGPAGAGANVYDISIVSTNPGTDTNYTNTGATGQDAIAIGPNALSGGNSSFAIGNGADATTDFTIAIGYQANAVSDTSIAIGYRANVDDTTAGSHNGIAIGANSIVGTKTRDRGNSVAIGSQAHAVLSGTAIGYQSDTHASWGFTDKGNSISIGNSSGVHEGIAIGYGAVTAILNSSDTGDSISIGTACYADSTGIAIGQVSYSSIGISIGYSATNYYGGIAIGIEASCVQNANEIIIGNFVGPYVAQPGSGNRTILGSKAYGGINGDDIVLGYQSVAPVLVATPNMTINGVVYTLAGTFTSGVLSIGHSTAQRPINYVSPGVVTSDSTDAINGSQLYSVVQAIQAPHTGYIKSDLLALASPQQFDSAFVTDLTAYPALGSAVSSATGGGSTVVRTFYNGSSWVVG